MRSWVAGKLVDFMCTRHIVWFSCTFGGRFAPVFKWAVARDRRRWTTVGVPGGSILVRRRSGR